MAGKSISKLDSYALLIIALSAVVVSIWQVNHQQKHDRISQMPYISWITDVKNDTTTIKIWNKGAGPAFITNYSFLINDKPFRSWKVGFASADSTIVNLGSITFGKYTLAPNEMLSLVSYKKGVKTDNGLQLNIHFESAYGDKAEDYLKTGL